MAKKAATRTVTGRPGAAVPVVAGREPCPCGSGRRYKACHGRAAARAAETYVARPFQGLPGECDWVALREVVPAATASLVLSGDHAGRRATLATVLPMAWPGLVRQDGEVYVGLQVPGGSGDASRDVADVLLRALAAEPGTPVLPGELPGPGPRLQDVLAVDQPFEVQVREGFDFWIEGVEERSPEVEASMERANAAVVPTARLASVEAAYWCQIRDRNHVRWVMPYDEETLLDAMARLHAAGADRLDGDGRYVGSFRALGLLVPVWDLAPGTPAEAVEEPAAAFAARLADAVADRGPLDPAQRRARAGLASRQITLR